MRALPRWGPYLEGPVTVPEPEGYPSSCPSLSWGSLTSRPFAPTRAGPTFSLLQAVDLKVLRRGHSYAFTKFALTGVRGHHLGAWVPPNVGGGAGAPHEQTSLPWPLLWGPFSEDAPPLHLHSPTGWGRGCRATANGVGVSLGVMRIFQK